MGLLKAYNSDKTRMREEDAAERSRSSEAEADNRQRMPKPKNKPRSAQPAPEKEKPTHHEVLGIRPTASEEEIELAYKGRRTQYHPDKYPNADEDTLKWATANMQAVNEAYAALSGQNRR